MHIKNAHAYVITVVNVSSQHSPENLIWEAGYGDCELQQSGIMVDFVWFINHA